MELNKIYNMDCLEGIKDIEDNSIDLVVTDPPYFVQAQGCGGGKNKYKSGNRNKGENSMFGKEDSQSKLFEYVTPEKYFGEISRIVKGDSHIYIFTNDKNMKDMLVEAEKQGLKLMNILTVNKLNGSFFSYYQKYVEFILFFRSTKGRAKYINKCGMGNYFEMKFPFGKNKLHPTEKPVDIIKTLIKQSSSEGDIVCDPFIGSGTTPIACIDTNRNYIGFELDKEHYDIANIRINKHKAIHTE